MDVGDEIPAFERRVGFAHWNRYAAVNDEFVPIHMDDAAGQAAGYPGAFGMGNLHVSYLHNLLRDWAGDDGRLVSLEVQFRGPSLEGRLNRARGVITGIRSEGGQQLVDLDVWVEDDDGTRLTPGTAVVALAA